MLVTMDVRFVAQPNADGRDLRDFLDAVSADPELDQLDVVVAWAKRSGLHRVRPQLEAVRHRPGTSRLIVGIDEGGATRQGLELAREIFSSVHVFHDASSRTFHPKIYLATGQKSARLLVGSNNLTAGGVYYNYEAALECVLQLPADDAVFAGVRGFIDRLYADSGVCLELTDDLFGELITNSRYRVRDEDVRGPSSSEGTDGEAPEDVDVDASGEDPVGQAPSAFGKSAEKKRTDPAPFRAGRKRNALPKKAVKKGAPAERPKSPSPGGGGGAAPGASASVVARWFKKMSYSDAQQPRTPTSGASRIW